MLENSRVAIWDRPATEANGRHEQRPIEQTGKYEGVFEGDALVVEPTVGEIAQEFLVRSDLRIRLIDVSEVEL